MKRWISIIAAVATLGIGWVVAQNVMKAPPMAPYVNVSEALKGALPNFIPGLGTLYVDAKNLPEGPFLAYDKSGRLVKVVFMVPLENLGKKSYVDIGTAALKGLGVTAKVDHVNIIPSGAHPGVDKPHVHFELVLVSLEEEKKVLEGDPY
jgi:hypothetical protein